MGNYTKKQACTLPYKFHSNLTVSSSTVFPQTKDTGDNVLMLLMYFNCKSVKTCLFRL